MNPVNLTACLIIMLGLLAQPVQARTIIRSLPYNCTLPGETYVLASDLALASGNAIAVTTDNIVIDGNGKTLTYANTGAGHAIFINFSVTRLEIKNFTLIQGAYDPAGGERVHAIFRNGNYRGIRIHDNVIRVTHSGSVGNAFGHGVHLTSNGSSTSGTEIFRNRITVSGASAGYGISQEGDKSRIYGNEIVMSGLSSEPAGYSRAISVGGRGNQIYDNMITLDNSSDTIQGISLWEATETVVHNNSITSAANHARAILIDGNSDNNRIYANRVDMISRHFAFRDASAGIRVRFGSDNNEI